MCTPSSGRKPILRCVLSPFTASGTAAETSDEVGKGLTALPIMKLRGRGLGLYSHQRISITDGQYLKRIIYAGGRRLSCGNFGFPGVVEPPDKAMKKMPAGFGWSCANRELAAFAQVGSDLESLHKLN